MCKRHCMKVPVITDIKFWLLATSPAKWPWVGTVNLPRLQSISWSTSVLSTAATELLILHQEGLRNRRGRGMHCILTQDWHSRRLFIPTGFLLKDSSLKVYERQNNRPELLIFNGSEWPNREKKVPDLLWTHRRSFSSKYTRINLLLSTFVHIQY